LGGELADHQGEGGEDHGDQDHGRRLGGPAEDIEQGDERLARDTAAAAEARVMPVWMVDRNWLGSLARPATSQPYPPSRSSCRSCPWRSEMSATSRPRRPR
jgi:hypothetical protein